jgi:hypothetical protein
LKVAKRLWKKNTIVWFGLFQRVFCILNCFNSCNDLLLFIILKASTYQEWTIIVYIFHCLVLHFMRWLLQKQKIKKEIRTKKDGCLKKLSIITALFCAILSLLFNIILQMFNHIDSYVTNDYFYQ